MICGGVKTWEIDVFIVFFAQAAVVTLETVIISLGRWLAIPEHEAWSYVGYIWVAGCDGIDPAVGALRLQGRSYLAYFGMREYSVVPILVFLS